MLIQENNNNSNNKKQTQTIILKSDNTKTNNSCNLDLRFSNKISTAFYNVKGYFTMQDIGKFDVDVNKIHLILWKKIYFW